MREAKVYVKGIYAGILRKNDDRTYEFVYDDNYFKDVNVPSVSLTMPKNKKVYASDKLFPFFSNMLSEGANKAIQCRTLKIDPNDSFSLLLSTAYNDTIGAVKVVAI